MKKQWLLLENKENIKENTETICFNEIGFFKIKESFVGNQWKIRKTI